MAPVYDFRHVELDKIGRGKRIVKPPGGECSGIFESEVEPQAHSTPRKSNNYMQSTIFCPKGDTTDNGHHKSPNTTPGKKHDDTRERLFGDNSLNEDSSPRKIVDRQKSNIFAEDGDYSPKSTPGNGHSSPESPTNGAIRARMPPGGPSSGIF